MKNNKFRRIQQNMLMNKVLGDNCNCILALMISLNRLGVSRAKVITVMDEYCVETNSVWNKYSYEDIQTDMINRFLPKLKLSLVDCRKYVETFVGCRVIPESIGQALAENVAIMLMQINSSCGYGPKRLRRLLRRAAEYKGDPVAEARERLGIDMELDTLYDVETYRYKPPKTDYDTARRLSRELEAVKKILTAQIGD